MARKSYSKSHLPKYANLMTGDVFQVFVSVLCYFSGLKFVLFYDFSRSMGHYVFHFITTLTNLVFMAS